jgi:hypothetical protein
VHSATNPLKLPGMASAFYRERVSQHLRIGIETMRLLREQEGGKPSFPQAARLQRTRVTVGGRRPVFAGIFILKQRQVCYSRVS